MTIDVLAVGGPMDGTVVRCDADQILYVCVDLAGMVRHEYIVWEIEGDDVMFNLTLHIETFNTIDSALQHVLRSYRTFINAQRRNA